MAVGQDRISSEDSANEWDRVPPMTPVFSAGFLANSISVSAMMARIWQRRLIFLTVVTLFGVYGIYDAHKQGPLYVATLDIRPVDVDVAAGVGGSSGGAVGSLLGSLSGNDNGSQIPEFLQFQAALTSEGVANDLNSRFDMVCRVFKAQCNRRTHTWKRQGGMRAWFSGLLAAIQSLPDPNGPRTPTDLALYVNSVDNTKLKSGIVELTYQHEDPKFAAEFLWDLWYATNDYLKGQDRRLRENYLAYLNQRINTTTTSLAQHEAIQNLILEQERHLMQTAADVPYAADILDGPRVAPANKVLKTMAIDLALGIFAGGLIAIFWGQISHFLLSIPQRLGSRL